MSDVTNLHSETIMDLPPEKVLRSAIENVPETVVVIGYDEDGDIYFASTTSDLPEVLWLIERGKQRLMEMAEEG